MILFFNKLKKFIFFKYLSYFYTFFQYQINVRNIKLLSEKPFIYKTLHPTDKICSSIFDNHNYNVDANTNFYSPYSHLPSFLINVKSKNIDARYLWEISRFTWITNKSNIINFDLGNLLINRFRRVNPYGFGFNWICTQDICIRALNLLYFRLYYSDCEYNKLKEIDNYIYLHFLHAKNRIEKVDSYIENHFLSNLVVLYIIDLYIVNNNFDEYFYNEINNYLNSGLLLNSDGLTDEGSLSYTCFDHEMLSLAYQCSLLFKQYKISSLLKSVISVLESSLSKFYIHNSFPNIGDNDSAKLFGFYSCDERFIYFKKLNNLQYIDCKLTSMCRLSNEKFDIMVTSIQPGKAGLGGHNHNDNGQMLLWYNKFPVFIDTGSFCYLNNIDYRNNNRSSFSHNICCPENIEMEEIPNDEKGVFKLKNIHKHVLNSTENSITYNYIGNYNWNRDVLINNDSVFMFEEIDSNKCTMFLIVNNLWDIIIESNNQVTLRNTINNQLCFSLLFESELGIKINIENHFVHNSFYKSESAKKIVVLFDKLLKWKVF